MDPIYVTGHRNPDTDSVVAAISYAALRNALGNRDYCGRTPRPHQRRDAASCSTDSAFVRRGR